VHAGGGGDGGGGAGAGGGDGAGGGGGEGGGGSGEGGGGGAGGEGGGAGGVGGGEGNGGGGGDGYAGNGGNGGISQFALFSSASWVAALDSANRMNRMMMNTPAHPAMSTDRVRVLEARPIAASSSFSSPGWSPLFARASASSEPPASPPQRCSPLSRQLAPSGSVGASSSVRRRGPALVLRLLRVEEGESCPDACRESWECREPTRPGVDPKSRDVHS